MPNQFFLLNTKGKSCILHLVKKSEGLKFPKARRVPRKDTACPYRAGMSIHVGWTHISFTQSLSFWVKRKGEMASFSSFQKFSSYFAETLTSLTQICEYFGVRQHSNMAWCALCLGAPGESLPLGDSHQTSWLSLLFWCQFGELRSAHITAATSVTQAEACPGTQRCTR